MDVYGIITDKIINLLEQGVIPWRKPWTSPGLPRNLVSKQPYRGINHFLLAATKYVSPLWLTMRQANQLGGHIRRGEESTVVIFWKVQEPERPENPEVQKSDEETSRHLVIRFYRVFNVEQCELPRSVLDKLPKIETREHTPISACAEIIGCMPNAPAIVHSGSKAFYSRLTDRVTLPPPELFASAEEYYGTTYHEIIHSTGHEKRLARASILEAAPFGSAKYCGEELIAEMGATYLCAESGISQPVLMNQAAYIEGWLRKLHDDRGFVIHAASHAQRAADYVLGRIPTSV